MIERSRPPCGEVEEPWAEVDEVRGMERKGSSFGTARNSSILSIRGALTETSGELMQSRMLLLGLDGDSRRVPHVGNGKDALRVLG